MKIPTRQTERLIWIECDPQEIAREKAKYPNVIDNIDEIPLATTPGKYLFNDKEIIYVLDTEYRYTGKIGKREVWITFLVEKDLTRKYSGFSNRLRDITETKRGGYGTKKRK